ncbi:uncharacterized protein LOC142220807 [Haematobia irritans]|uniref:uncharacterized protein LOC142220807 n=1 Tax=Haematobia irritans TaxID=7368 RepID=UPI003F4F8A18
MKIFRLIFIKIHTFFHLYHLPILVLSIISLMFAEFLHIQLIKYNHDLIYWIEFLQKIYKNWNILIPMAILGLVAFTIFLSLTGNWLTTSCGSDSWSRDLSHLEVKKRYGDFLLLRLISQIDEIEEKYFQNNSDNKIELTAIIKAYEEISKVIAEFRNEARKLLTPNETEIAMSIEDVYGIMESDEIELKKSKFFNMDIKADNKLLKKLVYS